MNKPMLSSQNPNMSKYLNSISIDCVIFGFDEHEIKILLIERAAEPSKGMWALPGGFVEPKEDLDHAAQRILEELTGLSNIYMEQVMTFGDVDRYPLGRVISIAYYALIKIEDYNLVDSPTDTRWHSLSKVPKLVFDHNKILHAGLEKLKRRVRYQPIGFELLPKKFTLTQLQKLYEAILGITLDKRNFRKKMLMMDLIIKLDESEVGVAHRAARYFKFDKNKYKALENKGFIFEV
jgi:8-oxo-dGTP diphosphatase